MPANLCLAIRFQPESYCLQLSPTGFKTPKNLCHFSSPKTAHDTSATAEVQWADLRHLLVPVWQRLFHHRAPSEVVIVAGTHQLLSALNCPRHRLPTTRPVAAGPSLRPRLRSCSSSHATRGSAVFCISGSRQHIAHGVNCVTWHTWLLHEQHQASIFSASIYLQDCSVLSRGLKD